MRACARSSAVTASIRSLPHVTLDQMTNSAKALIKGDASCSGVMKEGIRTKGPGAAPLTGVTAAGRP